MEKTLIKEVGVEYYDKVFSTNGHYDLDWEKYRLYDVYVEALHNLRGDENIFEIGCGCGQFAQALFQNSKCAEYTGFDFSDAAIVKARRLNKFNTKAWIFKADVYGVVEHLDMFFKNTDTIIAFEVFEHIRDLEVLDKIIAYKRGLKIIGSVPLFNAKSHLRYFNSNKDITAYYKGRIKMLKLQKIRGWYLFVGEIG
jgi:cyclopropane fatty-acyl-phospholipid synthase-like methyltransferase